MALTSGAILSKRTHRPDGLSEMAISFKADGAYTSGGTADFTAFVRALLKAEAAAAGDANVRGGSDVTIVDVVTMLTSGKYGVSYDRDNDKLKMHSLTPATITSADATDLASAQTLVNEIKAALNAQSANPEVADGDYDANTIYCLVICK